MTLGAWPKLELEAPRLFTRCMLALCCFSMIVSVPVRRCEEPEDFKALIFFFDWLLSVLTIPRERLDGRSPDPELKIRALFDFYTASLTLDF